MKANRWLYIARHPVCGHSRAACVVDVTDPVDVERGERFIAGKSRDRYTIEKTQDRGRFTLDDCGVCR